MTVVGKSVKRSDAPAKVTGATLYVDDYGYEGMLHAALVRSPKPRIRFRGFRLDRAKGVPGFVALVTAKDVPGKNLWPLVVHDQPFLPEGEALFQGQALAIVVAETPEAARRAAKLVEVDFEELPALTDPLKAMEPGALKLHGTDNVFSKYRVIKGDVEQGFREADVVVEGTFTTGQQMHAYLETQGMIAFPEAHGGMTVYGSMQCPYYVHDAVSQVLGVPMNKVRIVQRPTGGGFGGKEDVPALVGSHAAVAARVVGRPVKMIYQRGEDFVSMSRRHPAWMRIKYGAKKDGTLTACEVRYVLDGGAYATLSPIVLWRGTVHAAGPYRIPHVKVESFAVATNKAPAGAFRGFGQPQIAFGNESLIDELALKLKLDPLEFRLKNALRVGDATITGQTIKDSCGMTQALERARDDSDWAEKRRNGGRADGAKRRGIGVAANYYGVSLGARGRYLDRAAAQVQVQPDGTVIVAVGNTEIGQGAKTVLAQICADALNAPYEKIQVLDVDTTRVPDSGPTVASRTTLMSGNAILDACAPIRSRLFETVAEKLGVALTDVVASDGVFRAKGGDAAYEEVVRACWQKKLKMAEQGWYSAPPTTFDDDGRGDAYVTYAWSANVSEVEVDTETGEVKVLRAVTAHDIGKVINPMTAEGQVEGGYAQGLGYALVEKLVEKDGVVVNPNFTDYILPSAPDAPEFKTAFLEHPYPAGPFGAKGLAESPIIGPAPSIANAVRNACGVRLTHVPAMPEDVWEGLNAEKK
jgi:CO/xanthine dehydrogenase Mo-binding subunit